MRLGETENGWERLGYDWGKVGEGWGKAGVVWGSPDCTGLSHDASRSASY